MKLRAASPPPSATSRAKARPSEKLAATNRPQRINRAAELLRSRSQHATNTPTLLLEVRIESLFPSIRFRVPALHKLSADDAAAKQFAAAPNCPGTFRPDRKSTRLNSSHRT